MDSVIDRVAAIVKEAIKVNQINEQAVIGIGFSLQGTVNEEKFILEWAPNIGIRDINFNKYKEILKYPIYIENEANAAALAELNLGIEKEQENLVYISISSGIGAGVILEDTLYKGKNKRAGEIGHMTLIPDGRKCKCGRRGCFEMYASQKALIKDFNGINCENIESFQQFFELLNSGDARAKEYFDNYLNILAVGLQNIILVFDPDYIVLGGEISEFSQFYLDVLRGKVFEENKFYSKSDLKILPSSLQGDSSILGAALLPLERGIIFMDKNQ
jgi:predicted NBD/HSP70 family sugar kinase